MSTVRSGITHVALLALLTAILPVRALADDPLVFGIHPFLPSTKVAKKFGPLADYLGRETGRRVRIDVSRDYDAHIDRAGNGDYDFAYMGPVSYVRFTDKYGRVPLLGRLEVNGKPYFQGFVFVRKKSAIRSIEELAGRRVAFVTPSSTMGFIAPRFTLQQAGVNLENLGSYSFLKNHDNVALAVLVGDFDAGAVKEETFEKYLPRGLRAIARTPEVSEHIFVAFPDTMPETVDGLREALLNINGTEEGRKALRAIKITTTNIVPAADGDYDPLRLMLGNAAGKGERP